MVAFQYRKNNNTPLEQRTFLQNKQKQKNKNKNKTKIEGNILHITTSLVQCGVLHQNPKKENKKNFLKIDYVDN